MMSQIAQLARPACRATTSLRHYKPAASSRCRSLVEAIRLPIPSSRIAVRQLSTSQSCQSASAEARSDGGSSTSFLPPLTHRSSRRETHVQLNNETPRKTSQGSQVEHQGRRTSDKATKPRSSFTIGDTSLHPTADGIRLSRPATQSSTSVSTEVNYTQLREACQCPRCVHPSTKQRSFTSGQIYKELQEVGFFNSDQSHRVRQTDTGFEVEWGTHVSTYTPESTLALTPAGIEERMVGRRIPRNIWSGSDQLSNMQKEGGGQGPYSYADLLAEQSTSRPSETLKQLVLDLYSYGIVRITGVPTSPTENADCHLKKLVELLGHLRNSFYGTLWNVRNEPNSKNVAYTDLDLGPHMDLLYFTDPPRFQALHCLRNRVKGGESYFIDSFAAIQDLKKKHPEAYDLLEKTKLTFKYDNDGHSMKAERSFIEGDLSDIRGCINWSPPFQGSRRHTDGITDREGLEAISLWGDMLAEPARRLEFTLKEGEAVLFDNRRVLHARKSFSDYTPQEAKAAGVEIEPDVPSRWLKGCYLDGDVIFDRMAVACQDG